MGLQLPERQCPWCGAEVDESDGVIPTDRPHAGAASCCVECRRLSVFTAAPSGGLALRRATPAEAKAISQQPEVRAMLQLLRADPLRPRPNNAADVEPLVGRWRGRVELDRPLPGLPPLREPDTPSQ